jgi:hypothetical protein
MSRALKRFHLSFSTANEMVAAEHQDAVYADRASFSPAEMLKK